MILEKAEIIKVNDVLHTRYSKNVTITLQDAIAIDNAHISLTAGNDMFILVDVSEEGIRFDNDAKDYFLHRGKMMPFTKMVAIVGEIKSRGLMHKLLRRSRTYYDVKKFETVEAAMSWFSQRSQLSKEAS